MRARERLAIGWSVAGLSAALHALAVLAIRPAAPQRVLVYVEASAVEYSSNATRPAAEQQPAMDVLPTQRQVATQATRRSRLGEHAPELHVDAPQPAPSDGVAIAQPPDPPAVAHQDQAPKLDLGPQRAAAMLFDLLQRSEPQRDTNGTQGTVGAVPRSAQTVDATTQLNRSLRESAAANGYLAQRPPPALQRQSDGSYRYQGQVFSARIRTDGHVEFVDAAAVTVDGYTGLALSGHFDLVDAIEHGVFHKELYGAEKRWFLEQTAPLRASMEHAAHSAARGVDKRTLERELSRILVAAGVPPEDKRSQVLSIWLDCTDREFRADATRIIETFVRDHMPAGSPLGFSEAELDQFNRSQRGPAEFHPYRGHTLSRRHAGWPASL